MQPNAARRQPTMSFQPSSKKELRRSRALVRLTERHVRRLVSQGKKVHFIWDVDGVLVSNRSDDVFALTGFDLAKYFTYEERLVTQVLEDGPWAGFARKCGDLHQTQDIVTARSSFLALRVMFFILRNPGLDARWQLFVGHQPKTESYRIILKSFEKDPDVNVFCVDDVKRHVDAFGSVAAELGMTDRCHGIVSPQVRTYTEEDLRHEIDGVLNASGNEPYFVSPREWRLGAYNRQVQVVPEPRKCISDMLWRADLAARVRAIVEQHRTELEKIWKSAFPDKAWTDYDLFRIYEMHCEP
jgi:hypothetical protein